MVLPRSAGTFLISREAISWSDAAVSTSSTISPASRSRIVSRSFRVQPMLGLLGFFDDDAVLAVVLPEPHGDALAPRGRQVLADVVRPGPQPDEREVLGAAVLLQDLVGDAGEGPVERGLVEDLRFLPVAWWGAAHLLSLRASPGSLKGKHLIDSRHSTWRAPPVSTSPRAGRLAGAPALDGPSLVLDRDAARFDHEASRRQGRHDLLYPLALPHDQIRAAAGGAAVVAEVEDARW